MNIGELKDVDFSEERELIIDGKSFGKFSMEKMCCWHTKLNDWNWPADFPITKPPGFDELENFGIWHDKEANTKSNHPVFRNCFYAFQSIMSRYEILYHHNVFNLGKSVGQYKESWIEYLYDM